LLDSLLQEKMSSNDSNLVQEFEESFQNCLTSLTEEDDLYSKDPEDVGKNIDEKISQFNDIARQLETYFLQKRFMVYNHKPEMILKEDSEVLKQELARKDELIKKHYEKLSKWKEMLADAQVNPQSQASRPSSVPGGVPGASGGTMPGPGGQTPHGSFVPGNNYPRMPGQGQQHAMYGQQNLQGPLAYLERTTSNIGGPGPGSMGNMMNR